MGLLFSTGSCDNCFGFGDSLGFTAPSPLLRRWVSWESTMDLLQAKQKNLLNRPGASVLFRGPATLQAELKVGNPNHGNRKP